VVAVSRSNETVTLRRDDATTISVSSDKIASKDHWGLGEVADGDDAAQVSRTFEI
jgi:hypothetical protein